MKKTLSELIKECKGTNTFPFLFLFGQNDEWYAAMGSEHYFGDNYIDNTIIDLSEGPTPEEAMEKLLKKGLS